MTKQDIIRVAAKSTGNTQETAAAIIDAALTATVEALARGSSVTIRNYGRMEMRQRKARVMLSFTGQKQKIPASITVVFLPAQALKARLNGGGK